MRFEKTCKNELGATVSSRLFLITTLLLAGCSAGPPADIAGQYGGSFGAQLSDKKIGCGGELKQTGPTVTGQMHLTHQQDGRQFDLDCSVDGEVKGKHVTLHLHGKQEKFELTADGEYLPEGGPALSGTATLQGSDGSLPFLLKKVK